MAEEYKLEHLKSKCEMVLLWMPPSVKNLAASDLYKLKIVHLNCMEYAKVKPIYKLAEEEDFEKLKDSTLVKLIYPRVVALEKSICGIRDATRSISDQESCQHCYPGEDPDEHDYDQDDRGYDEDRIDEFYTCGHDSYNRPDESEEETEEEKCEMHDLAEDVLKLIPEQYL